MVDIHQHLAFGMDDGAQTEAMAVAMLDASYDDGVRALCVTPHIWPGMVPFDRNAYEDRLNRLREICAKRYPDMCLFSGSEMMYSDAALRHLQDGKVPTLANSRFVLTEFAPDVPHQMLTKALIRLGMAGYVPVLAHIERYACWLADVYGAQAFRDSYAVRYQVNAAEVLKPRTWRMKRFLRQMLAGQWIDYVASDAHDTVIRKTCMAACRAQLEEGFGAEYAIKITEGNQQEMIAKAIGSYTR
jgi:protein-tyrosine phosphatase